MELLDVMPSVATVEASVPVKVVTISNRCVRAVYEREKNKVVEPQAPFNAGALVDAAVWTQLGLTVVDTREALLEPIDEVTVIVGEEYNTKKAQEEGWERVPKMRPEWLQQIQTRYAVFTP